LNGATVIVNLSAGEEVVTKDELRRERVSGQSRRLICGYICAEAGEGESTQDSVFAGHSIIAENGHILAESDTGSGIIYTEIDVLRWIMSAGDWGHSTEKTTF
jgi:NAD+ synthase (glutamine-hydrolysing)